MAIFSFKRFKIFFDKNQTMTKIAILIDRLNIGGVEKTAIQQVFHLRKIGLNAHLVVLNRKSVVANPLPELTQKIEPIIYLSDRLPKIIQTIDFKFPIFAFFSFFHLFYPLIIPFYVKKKEFDYIISHSSYTTLSAITIKLYRKIPFSIFFWDPINYIINRVYKQKFNPLLFRLINKLSIFIDKFILNYTDYILVGSKAHHSYFNKIKPDKKIITAYPSSTIGKPSRFKNNKALMVTAWKLGKNPKCIIDIARNSPKVKIDLVGKWLDKKMLSDFKKDLLKYKLSDNIKILGQVTENKLFHLYPKYNVLLTTNKEMGFGMPVFEAACHGTTFIVPKGSGVCPFFKNKVDGYFFEENNIKDISKYLGILTTNKKLAKQMGLSAYKKASSYTWQKHVNKILSVINY